MSEMKKNGTAQGPEMAITLDHRMVYMPSDVEKILNSLGVRYQYWPEPGKPLRPGEEPAWDRCGSAKKDPGQYNREDVIRIGVDIALSVLHRFDFGLLKTARKQG